MPKLDFNSAPVEFDCPNCGGKLKQTLGRLKRDKSVSCGACGQEIAVDTSAVDRAEKGVQRSLDDLQRKLDRISKGR